MKEFGIICESNRFAAEKFYFIDGGGKKRTLNVQ
jgi:hypothetical protein